MTNPVTQCIFGKRCCKPKCMSVHPKRGRAIDHERGSSKRDRNIKKLDRERRALTASRRHYKISYPRDTGKTKTTTNQVKAPRKDTATNQVKAPRKDTATNQVKAPRKDTATNQVKAPRKDTATNQVKAPRKDTATNQIKAPRKDTATNQVKAPGNDTATTTNQVKAPKAKKLNKRDRRNKRAGRHIEVVIPYTQSEEEYTTNLSSESEEDHTTSLSPVLDALETRLTHNLVSYHGRYQMFQSNNPLLNFLYSIRCEAVFTVMIHANLTMARLLYLANTNQLVSMLNHIGVKLGPRIKLEHALSNVHAY